MHLYEIQFKVSDLNLKQLSSYFKQKTSIAVEKSWIKRYISGIFLVKPSFNVRFILNLRESLTYKRKKVHFSAFCFFYHAILNCWAFSFVSRSQPNDSVSVSAAIFGVFDVSFWLAYFLMLLLFAVAFRFQIFREH